MNRGDIEAMNRRLALHRQLESRGAAEVDDPLPLKIAAGFLFAVVLFFVMFI